MTVGATVAVGGVISTGCSVGLGSGVKVGSGVFVAVGRASAVSVYSIAMVAATEVKTAFMSIVGGGASGAPQALRARIKTRLIRTNGEKDF